MNPSIYLIPPFSFLRCSAHAVRSQVIDARKKKSTQFTILHRMCASFVHVRKYRIRIVCCARTYARTVFYGKCKYHNFISRNIAVSIESETDAPTGMAEWMNSPNAALFGNEAVVQWQQNDQCIQNMDDVNLFFPTDRIFSVSCILLWYSVFAIMAIEIGFRYFVSTHFVRFFFVNNSTIRERCSTSEIMCRNVRNVERWTYWIQ